LSVAGIAGTDGSSLPINCPNPSGLFDPYSTTEARRSMRGHVDFLAAASAFSAARTS